ncbi:MAG TPA: hypothetical protein PLC24_05100 [Myxococcota bacterium]|nr:hypothetical protein [Myxococcota bacterium]HOA13098.1 hypothetical protein [Myxococcota bacterium]HPV03926.1 hypothetical protein [Myxococcota bacterium]
MLNQKGFIRSGVVRMSLFAIMVSFAAGCSSGQDSPDTIGDTVSDVMDNEIEPTDSGLDLAVPDEGGTDLAIDAAPEVHVVPPCVMKIGVGKRDVSPVVEPFEDTNGNNWRDDGEAFTDTNDNDEYDPTYIAGFGPRQAQGIHDPIWSRCMAIESTGQAYLFCATDSIGMGLSHYDRIVARIKELRPQFNLEDSHVTWATTHTHQGPDTQGVWDLMPLEYLDFIDEQTAQAAVEALDSMVPAGIRVVSAEQPDSLVRDIDVPVVIDRNISIIQGVAEDGDVIGTLVSIANHPESGGPDNMKVSSDFPHYLRQKVEEVQGGMAIFFAGALGLMATPVMDWDNTGMWLTEQVGNAYGDIVNQALVDPPAPSCEYMFAAESRPSMKLENFDFWAGIESGLINGFIDYLYGESGDEGAPCGFMGCVDVPVSVVKFGELLTWVNVPGELTPELVLGVYPDPEPVPGEFADAEREPYLEQFIDTPNRFVACLSDTEIGYIYPRYQEDRPNHEHQRNSASPNVAGTLMAGYAALFEDIAASEAAFFGEDSAE